MFPSGSHGRAGVGTIYIPDSRDQEPVEEVTAMVLVVDTQVALAITILGHVIFPTVDVFSDVSLAVRLWRGIDRDLTVR